MVVSACARLVAVSLSLFAVEAAAQQQDGVPSGYGYSAPYAPTASARRGASEMGALYATAVLYGVGLGVWFGAEVGVEDPGIFLIAPAVLGVAAPAAVYALDRPAMRRGLAGAIAAGAVVGAGEGIGISSFHFVTAKKPDAWGFRGLSRATALGATLGAAGGAVLGTLQAPSPRSSVLVTSGVLWGSAIGAMFGYGASASGVGYGLANDKAALGGLIGYNIGLVATGALSTVTIPTTRTLEWMWAGAGIGFAASLPVYLFYAGEAQPPAKRGLLFSATATTLGIVAGALFTAGSREEARLVPAHPRFARVNAVGPLLRPGTVGLSINGELE